MSTLVLLSLSLATVAVISWLLHIDLGGEANRPARGQPATLPTGDEVTSTVPPMNVVESPTQSVSVAFQLFGVGSTPGPSGTPIPTRGPKPTSTVVSLSPSGDARIIEGVPLKKQERGLNCEFRSAADLAQFYGYSVPWEDIFLAVGHDPNRDPNVGFVGKSFEVGYGVYAKALAEGLHELGVHATYFLGFGKDRLLAEIDRGTPVIVWATADMRPAEVMGWYTEDGRTWVKAVRGEHTFTVVGYDDKGVYVNDPLTGRQRYFPWEDFLRSWGYLDQMVLIIHPSPANG